MGIKHKPKDVSLVAQQQHIRRLLPGFRAWLVRHACLVAEGDITPNPLAETYRIRIEYPQTGMPRVWVKDPALVLRAPWRKIPHMYDQERICLFRPGHGEWARDMLIADTIVPWAAEWLHYYELWHLTGEWLGGGAEPRDGVTYRNEESRGYRRGRRSA